MGNRILVFYGSYRSDRMGIRLAQFVVEGFTARGDNVELIDAKAIGLPMLDRMYKEYPKGGAPEALEKLGGQIRTADGLILPSRLLQIHWMKISEYPQHAQQSGS